jgi:uncharacterized protein (DUF58 family)
MGPERVAPAPALLRRVELAVGRKIHGLREGDHLALFSGRGIEAGDARLYSPGDDVRRMDWTVTARTGVPHVRDAVAERELDVTVLLDLTGSLDFGTASWRKVDLELAVLGALGSLATQGHDRLGAILLTRDGATPVPVRAGRAHLAAVMARAEAAASRGGSADLVVGIERLGLIARRRGLAVVISDFRGPITWERALARLAQRHDTVAIELVDPREMRLSDVGFVTVADAETGRRRTVDTSRPDIRAAFGAAADKDRAAVAAAISAAGATQLRLWTDRDWVEPLVRFLEQRRRARASGRGVPFLQGVTR